MEQRFIDVTFMIKIKDAGTYTYGGRKRLLYLPRIGEHYLYVNNDLSTTAYLVKAVIHSTNTVRLIMDYHSSGDELLQSFGISNSRP